MSRYHETSRKSISASESLQRLKAGNERFLRGEIGHSSQFQESLQSFVQGQQPYATILGCSDSRVPPELIFDAGLGELFIVRIAGNIFSNVVADSLRYARDHLQTPLLVVLGHEQCGAVIAALKSRDADGQRSSRIQILLDHILPGLPDLDRQLSLEDRIKEAVEANVRWTVRQILERPAARARTAEGKLQIVGAVYEIASGRVRFIN